VNQLPNLSMVDPPLGERSIYDPVDWIGGGMTARVTLIGCTAALVAAMAAPALAIDPHGARYLDDADELFWFLQISDTHVGEDLLYGAQDTDNLDALVGETVDTILPEFVVLTGDIVDATNGWLWPTWQYQDEWDEYRSVIDGWGMDITFFHDVSGNHDAYTDPGLTYYLGNSLTGQAYGTWHEAWTHSFAWGEYLFVGLNTADTDGSMPGLESQGLDTDELVFLEDSLINYGSADLAFVFTHYPLSYFDYGDAELTTLLSDHQVSAWANGHIHNHSLQWQDATLHFNLDSLGRSDTGNLGIFAVDHDGVAARGVDFGSWPLVLVTAPTDTSLGGTNPYSYPVSASQVANPVRALVFDTQAIALVEFEVDGADDFPMVEVAPSVWQGEWDCTGLTPGMHQLTVWATTLTGTSSHTIEVEVAVTECDDGLDNDGNGLVDHPDDSGCWGASDDIEAAGGLGDDDDTGDDDTGDDDSAGDDDTGDDDDSAEPDDDDTSDDDAGDDDDVADDDTGDDDAADDDSADVSDPPMNENPGDVGGGCGCTAAAGAAPASGLLTMGLLWGVSRRRGRRSTRS
jgi:hypothetical protein